MQRLRNCLIGFASAAFLAMLSGCANLEAIQEFGKLSADTAGYAKLTQDYLDSPGLRKQYTFVADDAQRAVLDKQSAERRGQAARLFVYHKTVAAYMEKLAELAGGELVAVDTEVGSLVDAAVKASYMTEAQADPVKSILGAIVGAALDIYRQHELKKIIASADAPLQIVIRDMVVLVDFYDESIKLEQTDARSYARRLDKVLREQDKRLGDAEVAWARFEAQDLVFLARSRAAVEYKKSLLDIGKAHSELYKKREAVASKEMGGELKAYSKRISAAYKVIRAPVRAD